jgi:glycine cleavage system H protein
LIEGVKFTKEHEWVKMTNEGQAIIGISDFAQQQLGDIVSVELPKVGSNFRRMQTMAIVDSVKASSDIYSPLSGEVIQVNVELTEHPEWINQSPYELGWMVKLNPLDIEELDKLMTPDQYREFIGETDKQE